MPPTFSKSKRRSGGIESKYNPQCSAIAITTGKRCLNTVTDQTQLTQNFPKCTIHASSCKRIYPKYKDVCKGPIEMIPENPRELASIPEEKLTEAKEDAKECASLRRQYTSECFGGTTDQGHVDIIDTVLRKSKMIDLELKRRKSFDSESGKEMFRFRSPTRRRSPSPLKQQQRRRSPSPLKQQWRRRSPSPLKQQQRRRSLSPLSWRR
jgi:hypothetical protein